jgi:transposase
MAVRWLITDAVRAKIEPRLAAIEHKVGSSPDLSDRLFIEARLSIARTGTPWRDLPKELGHWDTVYNRFRRWEARGIWRQLWECLQRDGCRLANSISSSILRTHGPISTPLEPEKRGGQ